MEYFLAIFFVVFLLIDRYVVGDPVREIKKFTEEMVAYYQRPVSEIERDLLLKPDEITIAAAKSLRETIAENVRRDMEILKKFRL